MRTNRFAPCGKSCLLNSQRPCQTSREYGVRMLCESTGDDVVGVWIKEDAVAMCVVLQDEAAGGSFRSKATYRLLVESAFVAPH